MSKTIIPFGPQHPVLPEPIHLSLTVEDEIVKEAVPAFGYVHRGLEKLAEIKDYHQMIQVVERVCGICSMIHAMCYCEGLETLMNVEVPRRGQFLRIIWSELHRIHSHLLWLGLYADSFGFESVFMQFWKIRERIMDINESTAGNRVIVSINQVGGVRRDLSPSQCEWILKELTTVEKETRELSSTMLNNYTVKKRTVGKGVLTRETAYELGAAGPVLRGSGIAQDLRQLKYEAFDELDFEPVVETGGDAYARGELTNDIEGCTLCGICAKKCPSQCIRVDRKKNLWELNSYACVFCGICVELCPKSCLAHDRTHKKPTREKDILVLKKEIKPKLKVAAEPA